MGGRSRRSAGAHSLPTPHPSHTHPHTHPPTSHEPGSPPIYLYGTGLEAFLWVCAAADQQERPPDD
jgi:hypothetical protein